MGSQVVWDRSLDFLSPSPCGDPVMDGAGDQPRFDRLRELFLRAVDLPRENRDDFLRREAAGDSALEAAIRELLRAVDVGESVVRDLVDEIRQFAERERSPAPPSFDPLPDAVEARFYEALLGTDAARTTYGRVTALVSAERQHANALQQRADYFRSRQFLGDDGAELLDRLSRIWSPERHAQRFEHVSTLGEGGFGTVTVVRDRLLGRKVARKTLRPKWGSALHLVAPELCHRFLDEAQVAAQLQHPGVPLLHDIGVTPFGVPFFTMRLVRGETLEAVIAKHHHGDPAWPRDRVLRLLLDVANAVDYAHGERVLHRDLKTLNVIIGRFGETCVLDWGLSRAHRVESARSAGVVIDRVAHLLTTRAGSPGFTAPEQWEGESHAGCDVFSVGAMLHVVLFGLPPPRMTRSSSYRLPPCERRADRALFNVCERAIAADPLRRFRSMGEFRERLGSCVVGSTRGGIWQRLRSAWHRVLPDANASPQNSADVGWHAMRPALADLSLVRPAELDPDQSQHADDADLWSRLDVVRALGVSHAHFGSADHLLGVGGMARVTKHLDSRLGRMVAIKCAIGKIDEYGGLGLTKRFLDEPQIAAQLDHPSVLSPHDIGVRSDGLLFVVQPFVRASDLYQFIAKRGPEGWLASCRLLLQAARALAHAHERGVIHRDVKPQNILLGEHADAYLGDWGLATLHHTVDRRDSEAIAVQRGADFDAAGRRNDNLGLETPGSIVGTPTYMAPETADGGGLTPSADVFGLGCSLFQALTGRTRLTPGRQVSAVEVLQETRNTPHPKVASVNPRAPRRVAAVCDRAVEFNPAYRFQNAGEFALALENALARDR